MTLKKLIEQAHPFYQLMEDNRYLVKIPLIGNVRSQKAGTLKNLLVIESKQSSAKSEEEQIADNILATTVPAKSIRLKNIIDALVICVEAQFPNKGKKSTETLEALRDKHKNDVQAYKEAYEKFIDEAISFTKQFSLQLTENKTDANEQEQQQQSPSSNLGSQERRYSEANQHLQSSEEKPEEKQIDEHDETQKLILAEKEKTEEQRKLVETEKQKNGELKQKLQEALREIEEQKKLVLEEQKRTEEQQKFVTAEKEKMAEVQPKLDSALLEIEEQKKRVLAEQKKTTEEQGKTASVQKELDTANKKIAELNQTLKEQKQELDKVKIDLGTQRDIAENFRQLSQKNMFTEQKIRQQAALSSVALPPAPRQSPTSGSR